jgi:hypothetical protein
LPDWIQDTYKHLFGGPVVLAIRTFLRRALLQAIWFILLDADFIVAWKNGMIVDCGDGITRRIYPRFFAYSLDYQEK